MKVLIINNNAMYNTGDGLYIYHSTGQFIADLKGLGADVENFHFREQSSESLYMATFNVLKSDFRITAIRKNRLKLLAYIKAYFVGIRRVLYNDFSYIFYPNSFSYLVLACILFRKPYGLYVRGEKGIGSRISIYLFRHASFVLTVSPAFTKKVESMGGNSETIQPMMDFSSQDIIRDRSYKNKDVYNLLFLSRVEFSKGIYELIHAMGALSNQGIRNISLNVVGEGPDVPAIEKLILDLRLQDKVKLSGLVTQKEHIRQCYLDSDIFICPSHHEGFPRVLYEAMIFGTPIITTMVGTISYLMTDNYNCLGIQAKDHESITGKIRYMIKNYPEMKGIANNATLTIDNYLAQHRETHSKQLFRKVKEELKK